MKKRTGILSVAAVAMVACFCSGLVFAAEEKSGPKLVGELKTGAHSKYVSGNAGALPHDGKVFQGSFTLTLSLPSGMDIYGATWRSVSPEGGWNSDFGDEADYYGGMVFSVGPLTFDAGYMFCDLYKVGQVEGDLHLLYLYTTLPAVAGFTPFLNLEAAMPTDEEILSGGVLYRAGVSRPLVKFFGQEIILELSLGGHDGIYGTEPEPLSFGRLSVSTTFSIAKNAGITLHLNSQKDLGESLEDGGLADDAVYGGVVFSFKF